MKVILLQDVKGLGKKGDTAKVSDGHARNLLIPKGMVKEATDANIRELEKNQIAEAARVAGAHQAAVDLSNKIALLRVTIETKGGEGGRLFGSITGKDIADGLMAQHKIEIDKRKIVLDNSIKQAGEHTVDVKLYPEVTAKLRVLVEVK
ncbi:MAG: 50S ribosomal protein L9 [Eubacteriales bacterium]|nr:50S ribosomal protein L9 [Eubacteriales bacterium]